MKDLQNNHIHDYVYRKCNSLYLIVERILRPLPFFLFYSPECVEGEFRRRAPGAPPPRLRKTILVGVRRSSTLSMLFQRFCQRGSLPTSGSNQMPGPPGSSTPS